MWQTLEKMAAPLCEHFWLFIDKFANDFGHATPFGNRIIANNVARQLLELFESKE